MLLSGLNSECCGLGGVVSLISFFSPLDCLINLWSIDMLVGCDGDCLGFN